MLSSQGFAGFWRRFVAYIIDALAISVALWLLDIAFGVGGFTQNMGTPTPEQTKFGLMSLLVSWLYFALQESSARQATLGKSALGIIVTDDNGQRVSFGRATGRHFAKILSGIILGIGYLMAGFTARKQALHDMIAGTLVMKK